MREDADVAARIAIGGVAGDDHQEQHRRQLGDADQAERPRVAGALVELPADRDVDHLPAGDRGEAADGKRSDEGMTECGVRVGDSLLYGVVRIGIQTWGSEGDIRPFVALGAALAQRGHAVELLYTEIGERRYEDGRRVARLHRARRRLTGRRRSASACSRSG